MNHIGKEAVFVYIRDPVVHSRQEINQLLKWGENRAIFDVQADNVLYISALIGGRLTAQKLPRLLVQVIDLVAIGYNNSIWEGIEHTC